LVNKPDISGSKDGKVLGGDDKQCLAVGWVHLRDESTIVLHKWRKKIEIHLCCVEDILDGSASPYDSFKESLRIELHEE